ncbi:hypothetical protein B0H39_004646 [Clostridium beijerinckii]|uniref:hypothetical protein n=1 Tax=Clostridium beijerinckii TaxID=1520 RepID=UPI0014941CEA|nr:hypothetical protein [Clostridium beijerinckii]NOW86765.1 hypothetical protein [Clostridium beijerinckii]
MADFAIHLNNVKFKPKSKYTLLFEGDCTNSDLRTLRLSYSGADLNNDSSIVIPEELFKQLKDEFNNDFGYGPFDLKQIKSQLNKKNSYYLNYK